MKNRTGFLKVACACVVMLMQSLDAGSAPKKHAAGVPCRLKELTALTKHQVEASLADFDKANGKHLGTWSPGFPELQVQQSSPLQGSEVQCCLLFMAQGLENVLEDQKKNLNPEDASLHGKLRDAICTVKMLAVCGKEILRGECLLKPSPPKMPKHVFERKQWSHTLLKTARDYLGWLESKIGHQITKSIYKVRPNGAGIDLGRTDQLLADMRKKEWYQSSYEKLSKTATLPEVEKEAVKNHLQRATSLDSNHCVPW